MLHIRVPKERTVRLLLAWLRRHRHMLVRMGLKQRVLSRGLHRRSLPVRPSRHRRTTQQGRKDSYQECRSQAAPQNHDSSIMYDLR